MEPQQALGILENLANGIDPTTGELFPLDSPYNNPTVIRAMFICLGHIKLPRKRLTAQQKQAYNEARGLPRNAGLPWTETALESLEEQFGESASPSELAEHFGRSKKAIVAQLIRRGCITEQQAQQM